MQQAGLASWVSISQHDPCVTCNIADIPVIEEDSDLSHPDIVHLPDFTPDFYPLASLHINTASNLASLQETFSDLPHPILQFTPGDIPTPPPKA